MFISTGARLSPAYYLSSLCKTWVACTMQERPEFRTENKADYFPFVERVQPCVFSSKQESGAVQGGKRESQHCLVGDVQTLKYKAKSSRFSTCVCWIKQIPNDKTWTRQGNIVHQALLFHLVSLLCPSCWITIRPQCEWIASPRIASYPTDKIVNFFSI